ncbi:hypothetical protein AAZX31_10G234800 [Glycine max]|uniref:Uncharacterized protein n=2 Tax=Glycine subgen. Soja TaxID=1462606 RepID=I1LE39_SOYBN|nr:uncharacterized protein LOC102667768 [Glycine max]XP_028183976.1 uncharacterized protein LOC114370785 [Glycine soja]KAG4998354.1 hypothetical protein JHK85_029793 [Glycine max]KAG5005110.1 hypothetical protein JHK86_029249 [Glycine max]KAG5128305.1 hypothetical protein JHK82_029140 [Glycine max]KAG5152910.1 hypothetical protein JHK84_029382 [Glycine max]KAH1139942.1 hypothetical protein GYH30_029031 [Glycine max]|eukprot:XP_006589594.1 uncharacterized protein LOC102667768 [Glycine max]
MRTVFLQSKTKSSTSSSDEDNNSCYFPGCKKDANCNCEMCLASINATLDLMPNSVHKGTLTKLSASKPNVACTPISFDASILSTPRSSEFQLSSSTPLSKSRARSDLSKKMEKHKKGQQASGFSFLRLMLFFGFFLSADLVFPLVVSGVFQPSLSPDVVKRVGEKCSLVRDLNGKLRLLQKELASVVVGEVSNCSFTDTLWEISQDGLLLNSRCTLYKSAIEEVTIWGWPLQTAGLLTNGFSSRTFTLLSGRVTQWNGGQIGYSIRTANASWVQPKWDASAVQLDPNTWVLEYQMSYIFDGTRLHSAALEFLKYRISRIVARLKKDFWLFIAFEDKQYNGFTAKNGPQIPT